MDERRYRPLRDDERSVSDVLGYILTFSVVAISVFAASTVGFDQLRNYQQTEELRNAERAFQIIEQNFDQIQQSQSDARRSEISLESGGLAVEDPAATSEVTVTVTNTSVTETIEMNSLRYTVEDTIIAFEGGAVFYSDDEQNTILEDGPEMFCRQRDDEQGRAIVSVVTLDSEAGLSFGGGTIGITGELNRTNLLFPKNRTGADSVGEATGVTVTIDSKFDEAWEEHFVDDDTAWQATGSPNTYECTDSDGIQVFVRQSRINVSFAR